MSTLTKGQLAEVVALLREEIGRRGSESAAAESLGISQQLVNKAIRRGEIGVVAVRKIATRLGRPVAGISPDGTADAPAAASPAMALAALSPVFAIVAEDARGAGYSEEELNSAAVRLRGRAPTPDEALDAIRAARAGIARLREADAPGFLTHAQPHGKPKAPVSGRAKPT